MNAEYVMVPVKQKSVDEKVFQMEPVTVMAMYQIVRVNAVEQLKLMNAAYAGEMDPHALVKQVL